MKRAGLLGVILLLLVPTLSTAQERRYKGEVLLDNLRTGLPAKHVDVRIREVGNPSRTDQKGYFDIFLPDRLTAGKDMVLEIKKNGYLIQVPLDGVVTIPENLDKRNKILLLKFGSPLLLSALRTDKILIDSQEMVRTQVNPGEYKAIDQSPFFGQEATRLGLEISKIRQSVRIRGEETKQSDDPHKLGLAATAENDLTKAGTYFEQSASRMEKDLERKMPPLSVPRSEQSYRGFAKLITAIVKEYRVAGHAYYNSYDFEKALKSYEAAAKHVDKENDPQLWAAVKSDIGLANWAIGIRAGGEAIHRHLATSITGYQQALEVYTPELFPQNWAMTQNNLGNTLKNQGIRARGEDGLQLLAKAVIAYQAALTVFTPEQLPQDWAMTQNNLGNTLREQGIRTSDEDGRQLLAQAVAAYQAALTVYIAERFSQEWAMTQNNLGVALYDQGIRTSDEEGGRQLLARAVAAYQAALTVRTRDRLQQQWATTENNLGNALSEQGIRAGDEDGRQLLAQAVAAYQAALTVFTPERLPQDWAMTQNNLGTALNHQGIRTRGDEGLQLLAQAVAAYQAALTVYTREDLPEPWAQTQNNLAEVYLSLKAWARAAEAYRNVLTLYPNYPNSTKAYLRANGLYHDKLFAHEKAFDLNQQWCTQHPDDLSAQANFAELHIATARFEEAEARLASLISNPQLQPETAAVLQVLEIANLVALNKMDVIPGKLDTLQDFIASQPENFTGEWSFEGTKHFIGQNGAFSKHRAWLLDLLTGLEGRRRDEMLIAIDFARKAFQEAGKS